MKTPWFVVAMVEFIILLVVLGQKALVSMMKRSEQKIEKPKKSTDQIGEVRRLIFCSKGIGGMGGLVTLFEIHKADGSVFLAGIAGHESSISEGCQIEFWASEESIANEDVPRSRINEDGTKSVWVENIEYYSLEKYRVLAPISNESEFPAIETTMD